MKVLLCTFCVFLFCFSTASAGGFGFACFDQKHSLKLSLAFHEANGEKIALMDGDISNPLPADWGSRGSTRASIEGPDFLAVLDKDLTLNILEKDRGLITLECFDITDAARTLNNDFGTLASLKDQNTKLAKGLDAASREIKSRKAKFDELADSKEAVRNELQTARSDLQVCVANAEAQRGTELLEQIKTLEQRNERLIKNSRMWQDRIEVLENQLKEN